MVAIVSGNTLGLNLGSLASLGSRGQFGGAALGQSGERAYVNVATGNLVLQDVDTSLMGVGNTASTVRTYNSQGQIDYDNADGWHGAPYKSVVLQPDGTLLRTDSDGSTNSFSWDAASNAFVGVLGAGQALDRITVNGAGDYVFTDGTTGREEIYQGAGAGLILSSLDTSGNQLTYTYDAQNLLTRVENADGEAVNYSYSGRNLTQISTSLAGGQVVNELTYTYDSANRLRTVSVTLNQSGNLPSGSESGATYTTTYTYSGSSTRVASVTQSDGTRLNFTYVNSGGLYKVASVTDGVGQITRFAYNNTTRTTTVTDALGLASTYRYDAAGQLAQVRTGVTAANPNGLTQLSYSYDGRGDVLAVTDGLGQTITFGYDAQGNQTSQIDALGNALARTFNGGNQLLTETVFPQVGQALTTRYVYDADGRNLLRFVISAEGHVSEYRYDASGLRTSAIQYGADTYDLDGLAAGDVPTEAQLQAWADAQDLTQTERSDLAYDHRGQLQTLTTYTEVDATGSGAGDASTVHYVYDQKGELLQTISPDGAGISQMIYDGLGRVVSSSSRSADASINITTLTQYDDANGRTTVTLANGLATVSAYDRAGRVISVSQNAGGPALGTSRLVYDALGNVAMAEDPTGERRWTLYDQAGRRVADIGPDGQLTEYVFDRDNRLTETIAYANKVDTSILVDGAGNPLTLWNANPSRAPLGVTPVTLDALRQPSVDDQKSWNLYDAADRLCFQVDALGRVTQTQYDGASRVIAVSRLASPIDTSQLANGRGLEMLLGGFTTTTQLSEYIDGAGPNAPRVLTAQVTGFTPASGIVSFYASDVLLGTAALADGVATLVVSNLPVGLSLLKAVYAGEGDNLGSASNGLLDDVQPAQATTTVLTATAPSSAAGESVTLAATVSGASPGGMVTFYSGSRAIGIAAVVNGVATVDVNNLPRGNNVLSAVYQGDAYNAQSTSATVTEVVNRAPSTTAESVTTLMASNRSSAPGAPVTLTAQVSGATPGGTVNFYNLNQLLGSATLVNGLATLTVSNLPAGVDRLRARYLGDTLNTASNSAYINTTVLAPSTVGLAASASSASLGEPLTFTASVSGTNPGGVVSFFNDGVLLGSAAIVAGQASLTTFSLPLGSSTVTAVYSGDASNAVGSSTSFAVTIAPASTETVLSTSAGTTAQGADLTLTAAVSGTGAPSGTVTFYNGTTALGSASVVGGVAVLTISNLSAGTASLTAVFEGDAGNVASSSTAVSQTIASADYTQTALSVSAISTIYGAPVTLTARINGAGTASGSVTFYNGATVLGTAVVSGGVASLAVGSLPVGVASINASYGGDASHAASASDTVSATVQAAPTSLGLASSAVSAAYGAAVLLTATLGGGAGATGTVTFFNGRTAIGTATLAGGQATLSLDTLPVGTLALSAAYAGDAGNASSVAALSQVITTASTTTTIAASQASAKQGAAVILTAHVASSTTSRPGGTVTFYSGTDVLGTATVSNGFAALTVASLAVGSSVITASYAGDARNTASTSAGLVETIAAAPQASVTTLTSSAATVTQGSPFTLTANVTGASTAGGVVTFLNGLTVLGTAAVDAGGVATLTTNIRVVGNASIYATFGGDSANATSVSARVAVRVNAGALPPPAPVPVSTTTTLTASVPSAVRGDPVTLFARVDRSVTGVVPSGTVSFFAGTTLVGSASLVSGQASITFTSLPVGADQIKAVYSGDAQSATSTSAVLAENISLANSTVTLTQSATSVAQGAALLLTAQVAGNVAPGGTVSFYSGATLLATVGVVNGLASRNVTTLPVGTATITARYNGDANNAVSTSTTSAVNVTAAPVASTVSLASSMSPSPLGEGITLTADVAGTNPQGTVSFFNNNTLLGSATLVGGHAVFATSGLPRGNANLRAVYSGDAGNLSSTSAVVVESVVAADTLTSLTTSSAVAGYGSALTLTASVTGPGNPAGTVRFYNGTTLLGQATLSGGLASLTVNNLPVGTDALSAVYLGNAGNVTSTSTTVNETITPAPTTLSVTSPGTVAQNGVITVQVAGVSPTGNVTFLSGQAVLGVAAVVAGVATLNGVTLPPGTYDLSVTYGGNTRNAASVLSFSQTITAAQSVTTLTTASTYVAQNAPLVITAQVAGSDPTGTVTFYSGATEIGTATLSNGLGAITVSTLDDGIAPLTAVYSGDANNTASTSAVLNERVVTAPVNLSVSSSAASVQQGQPLTLAAQISGDNPTGSIAFVSGMTTLGVGTIVNGVAVLSLAQVNLAIGAQDIVAVYMGDGNNAATLSSTFAQTVTQGIATVYTGQNSVDDRTITQIQDGDGHVRAMIDAEGYLTEMRYNAAGRLVQTVRYANRIDGFVNATSIEGRVIQARMTGSLSSLVPTLSQDDINTYVYYNARGQKSGEVDGEGYLTEFVYDANGNLAQQIRYATAVTAALPGSSLAAVRPASSPLDSVNTNTWDALNRLSTQTNAEGTVAGYAYDSVGRVVSTSVAMNTDDLRTLTVRYDVQGHLVAELSPEGAAQLSGSQSQAEIDSIWDQYAITHTYDAAGRRTSTTDANGNRTVFLYDEAGRLRYTVNALGEVQERRYGALGRLEQTVSFDQRLSGADLAALQGGVLSSTPATTQAAQILASLDDGVGDSVNSFYYDATGQLIETTDAESGDTLLSYNVFGELTQTLRNTGEEYRITTNSYDRRGLNIQTVNDPLGSATVITQATYDAFGRVTSTIDGNGHLREQHFDRLGRVILTSDPLYVQRTTSYDAFDRVLTQTDGLGHATQYAYDNEARSVTVTTAEGITVTNVHNRHGQTQSVTDGNGNTTSYSYDHNGSLVETDTPQTTSTAEYDNANRLISTVDANGVEVAYAYDAANRLLTRTLDPDGLALQTQYGYDAKGQRVTTTDANGVVTQTRYDLNGRVLTQTVDPAGLNLTTTYAYNRTGEVLRVTSPGGTVMSYVYDGLGRRVEEHLDPDGMDLVCRYAYDSNGNMVRKTDANGVDTLYAYDENNRLVFTVDGNQGVRENTYDLEGRLVRTTAYANRLEAEEPVSSVAGIRDFLSPSSADSVQDRVFDDDGRLSFTIDGAGGITQYVRDGNGNVVRQVDYVLPVDRSQSTWLPGTLPSIVSSGDDREVRIVYDSLNRTVWTVDGAGSVSHMVYDGNGNVVERTAYATKVDPQAWSPAAPDAVPDPAHDKVVRTVFDAANRAVYLMDGTGAVVAQKYDDNGNTIERVAYAAHLPLGTPATASALDLEVQSLSDSAHDVSIRRFFDAANRQVWSVDGTGAVTGQSYDDNGNLVKQVAYATAVSAGGNPAAVASSDADRVTLMGYDTVNQKIWQVDALGGLTRFSYDAVGNVLASTAYQVRVAAPTAASDPANVNLMIEFSDQDRTARAVYDGANRQVLSIDPSGAATQTVYDGIGNAIATIRYAEPASGDAIPEPTGADRRTLRAFDGAGRQVYSVDSLGFVSETQYDGTGQITSTTQYAASISGEGQPDLALAGQRDAIAMALQPQWWQDRTDRFSYDGGGNLISSTDAMWQQESYTRDGLGNKISFTNKNGNTWTYDYDATGRLVTETAPLVEVSGAEWDQAIVTKLEYDALGNLTSRTEAFGIEGQERTTSYEYDALGRQVKTTFPPVDVYDSATDDVAANGANGVAEPRVVPNVVLSTQITYDVFGDAVANRDVAGNYSYKTYDKLGRVAREIDALGYVSGYERDTFGDATTFGRAAVALSLPAAATSAQVQGALAGLSLDGARLVTTEYDQLGRAVQVTEPTTWVSDGAGGSGYEAAKVTQNTYNAFGEVVQTGVRVNSEVFVATTSYYDLRGQVIGTVDPLGYVTTQQYDSAGNVIRHTEYANSTGGNADPEQLVLPEGNIDDRVTVYGYDQLNRKTSETRLNVEYSDASDGSVQNDHGASTDLPPPPVGLAGFYGGGFYGSSDVTTTYQYDAVGNLLSTTDALGGVTTSEYDALGRVVRVIAPSAEVLLPWGDDTEHRPETVFQRDAYGNVVVKIQKGVDYSGTDRVTETEYDLHGHATKVTDAEGYEHFMSYDAHGQLVKQWQGVAGNGEEGTHTLYTLFKYDALGRQTDIVTPGTNSVVSGGSVVTIDQAVAGVVHTSLVYNAFGEVVERGTYRNNAVQLQEKFVYDSAGHLILSNAGDGIYKAMIYNVLGYQTVQVTSSGVADLSVLSGQTTAQAADTLTEGVRRSEAVVDALGRVLEQHLPERMDDFTEGRLDPVIYQTFDRWGNVVSQTDPRDSGLVTTFRYNANNQVVQQTQPGASYYGGGYYGGGYYGGGYYGGGYYGGPVNPTTHVRYDKMGRQVAVVDANGHVNGQLWDESGQLLSEVHADGGVVHYRYNAFGERIQLEDAESNKTNYTYDNLGRVTRIEGDTVTIASADANFNVATTSGQLASEFTYDSAGRKLSETNGAGETTLYDYDLRGNVIATTQAMGQVSRAAFDEFGHQTATQDPNGALSTWAYDSFGQLQGYTDIGGANHVLHYDNARQLIQQTSDRSVPGQTGGQNIQYRYDAAGQLVRITDAAVGRITQYSYDAAGHRLRENTEQNGITYQDNWLHYDQLGRLDRIQALDNISIQFEYDAVGNKIHQHTEGNALARSVEGTTQVQTGIDESGNPTYTTQRSYTTVYDATSQDMWYAYDAMNRQILVDGVNNNGDISANNINSAQGHVLTYDLNGNRKSDTHWGQQVTRQEITSYDESGSVILGQHYANREGAITEYYTYDKMSRLETVATGGFDINLNPLDQSQAIVLDSRTYDAAGRLVRNGPAGTAAGSLPADYIAALNAGGKSDANGAISRVNRYDANGRLLAQHVTKPDGKFSYDTIYAGTVNSEIQVQTGVDEDGNPVYTTQTVTQTGPGYDAAGNILGYRVTDETGVVSSYNMTMARFEGYKEGTTSGFRSDNPGQVRTTTNQYDVNGQLIGITDDTGSDVAHRQFINDTNGMVLLKTQQSNVFKQLVVMGQVYASYGMAENPQSPGTYTNQTTFDPNYQAITNGYPSAGVGAYTVRSGDSLETIAQASYGDSQLWYLIADANGLRGDSDLRVGQTLNIPAKVGSIHNNSGTFKPYNPNEVIGDTTPTLPVPQSGGDDGGCGGLGQIIMIVVAVVVTVITQGATTEFLVAALGETGGAIAAGAVAAAAGSIASQVVGNAIGAVDGFSWKAVALAAVGGGVSGGLSGVNFTGGPVSGLGNTIVRAAVGNALTQGIAVATGLQDKFSWSNVAAAAIGAGVTAGVADVVGPKFGNTSFGKFAANFVSKAAGGLASAVVSGGRVNLGAIAADAFGNALASSFVSEIQRASTQQNTLTSKGMQLRSLDALAARPGVTAEELERIATLRAEVESGQHGLSITTRDNLQDDAGNAANARFNPQTGAIEIDASLVAGAGTRDGAAGLLGAVLEEHGEWAANKLGIQYRNSAGAALDTGAMIGLASMARIGASLSAQGLETYDFALNINGEDRSFTTDASNIYQASARLFTPDRILMNVSDRQGYYQSTTFTSALDQIYAKLRSGVADLGNKGAQMGGFVFGIGEQAVGMAKGLGQLALDSNLASAYLIAKAVGGEDYLPSAFAEGYGRMQSLYSAASNFVKLPVGEMLSKIFLDPVVHSWQAANAAYSKASATEGFAPNEWFDYGRALGGFAVNIAMAAAGVVGAGGLVRAGYTLGRMAAGGLEGVFTRMAAEFGETQAAAARGTASTLGEAAAATNTIAARVGRNTVTWTVDASGSPISAEGSLAQYYRGAARSSAEVTAQGEAGAAGIAADQGGHLVGHRFVLDQGGKNLFPQNGNFNTSAFKTLENDYARLIDQGYEVRFSHVLGDFDSIGRPGSVTVSYQAVDRAGAVVDSYFRRFLNQAGEVYTRRVH